MLGLIYKDIVINKKCLLCSLVLCVAMISIFVDDLPNKNAEFSLYINILTFLSIIIVYSLAEFACNSDNKDKWDMFLGASPIKNKIIIAEKYIFDYIFVIFGAICSFIIMYVLISKSGREFMLNYCIGINLSVTLIFLYSAFKKNLEYLYGKKKAENVAIIFVAFIFILIVGFVLIGNIDWMQDISIDVNALYVFFLSKKAILLIPISAMVHMGSFFLSYKRCERKKN